MAMPMMKVELPEEFPAFGHAALDKVGDLNALFRASTSPAMATMSVEPQEVNQALCRAAAAQLQDLNLQNCPICHAAVDKLEDFLAQSWASTLLAI